jgi:Protein of unknown function (DUF3072)
MATKKQPPAPTLKTGADESNKVKDPDNWTSGDEPMTGAQASYLRTLSEETGEAFNDRITKAQAFKRIDELRARDPRLQRRRM